MMCVYKITNPDGLIYIRKTTNYESRLIQYKSNSPSTQPKIRNSLLKYGFNNHLFEVIKECSDENMLFKYECYNIGLYNSINSGLNITLPTIPSNLLIKDDHIIERKFIKYELLTHPNYVWTKDDLCFNLKTGRRIKQVYKNGMIGYCINSKFMSLTKLRPLLRKPAIIDCPF